MSVLPEFTNISRFCPYLTPYVRNDRQGFILKIPDNGMYNDWPYTVYQFNIRGYPDHPERDLETLGIVLIQLEYLDFQIVDVLSVFDFDKPDYFNNIAIPIWIIHLAEQAEIKLFEIPAKVENDIADMIQRRQKLLRPDMHQMSELKTRFAYMYESIQCVKY